MPEKRSGLPNWVYLLLGATVLAGYLFVKYLGQRTILKAVLGEPAELVNRAMRSAKVSPRITNRTGKITAKNFKVEKLGANKDTLVFRFFLDGERADATVKLWMAKRPSGDWKIVKSDTLFAEQQTSAAPVNNRL
jgi:predicted aminopeptidase